jgi:ABC-type sugar transport system permease subunit
MVVASILWTYVYHPTFGLYTLFAKPLGLYPLNWLTTSALAMPALIIFSWWKGVGYYMILFLAGLQNIPEEYYEAAKIDGANSWGQFVHITLPLLRPTTLFVTVVCVIGAFQVFAPALLMTNGGPAGATRVLPLYLYEHAFQFLNMGYASAIAVFMFVVLIILTFIQVRVFRLD